MPDDLDDLVEEILVGGLAAEDGSAWKRLVAEPGGARAWASEVARQKRRARIAALVAGRPWMAQVMLSVRRAARRIARPAFAAGTALIESDVFQASLGSADASSEAASVRVEWGESEILAVPIGATVTVVTDGPSAVWWMTSRDRGPLPTKAWTLEPGEAPVVLAVVHAREASEELDELLPRHVAALIVLIEREPAAADEAEQA